MKLYYPNNAEVPFDKAFIAVVNNKDYFFYTNGTNTVAFGELKEGSLFAVAPEELETFKTFLIDFANNKAFNNPNYSFKQTNLEKVVVYGGSQTQIDPVYIEEAYTLSMTPTEVVAPTPVAEPVQTAPAVETTSTEPVQATPAEQPAPTTEPVAPIQSVQAAPVEQPAPASELAQDAKPSVLEVGVEEIKEAKPKKKGGSSNIILIIVLLAIMVGGIYFIYTKYLKNETTKPVVAPVVDEVKLKHLNCTLQPKIELEEKPTQREDVNVEVTFTEDGKLEEVRMSKNILFETDAEYQAYKTAHYVEPSTLPVGETQFFGDDIKLYSSTINYRKGLVSEEKWTELETKYKSLDETKTMLEQDNYYCSIN
jgi:hypothetical protein